MVGKEVSPWSRPGMPAEQGDGGRVNYDTINGGPPIKSINGATKKGDDGYHDPYQKPPNGMRSWHDVSDANMDAISLAVAREALLKKQGYHYNPTNGTWVDPQGGVTTLSRSDPGPPGGVDYHWQDRGFPSERQQVNDAYSDDPRRPYDIEGEVEDDQEGQSGVVGLFHWAANQSLWGRFLKLFGK